MAKQQLTRRQKNISRLIKEKRTLIKAKKNAVGAKSVVIRNPPMKTLPLTKELIERFNKHVPRYTSYPTAPEWGNDVNAFVYAKKLRAFGQSNKTLSLYVHIPFCHSMCYFCSCNTLIRLRKPAVGDEYLGLLFKEMALVRKFLGRKVVVKQLHFGGGTPTFLEEGQLEKLLEELSQNFDIDFNSEIAIKIDPRTTNSQKIKRLRQMGFNRI